MRRRRRRHGLPQMLKLLQQSGVEHARSLLHHLLLHVCRQQGHQFRGEHCGGARGARRQRAGAQTRRKEARAQRIIPAALLALHCIQTQ